MKTLYKLVGGHNKGSEVEFPSEDPPRYIRMPIKKNIQFSTPSEVADWLPAVSYDIEHYELREIRCGSRGVLFYAIDSLTDYHALLYLVANH